MRLKQNIERSRVRDYGVCQHCSSCCECSRVEAAEGQQGTDLTLWTMLERNKYLEGKIEKLRGQYEKQSRTIGEIKQSDRWQNRFVCGEQTNSCYQEKYLQLLRVRSPFY